MALDADTGKIKWHYQEVPHDTFDFDAAYEPVLFDQIIDGKMRQLIVHPNKGGYTRVIDRTTGKFVNAWPHVDAVNWLTGVDKDGKLLGRLELKVARRTCVCPDWGGGRSWNHSTIVRAPETLVQPAIEWCSTVSPAKRRRSQGRRQDLIGGGTGSPQPPRGRPATAHLDAYDPVRGQKNLDLEDEVSDPVFVALDAGGDLLFVGDVEGKVHRIQC